MKPPIQMFHDARQDTLVGSPSNIFLTSKEMKPRAIARARASAGA